MLEITAPLPLIKSNHRSLGFTLIELMVTLSLLAILTAVATPSFVSFQRNSELTSITNTLIASLNAARSEAMKRNMNAMVVTANNDKDWSQGWYVFVDADRDGAYSASDITVMSQPALPSYITISGTNSVISNPSYIQYDGSGFSKPKSGDFANSTFKLARNDTKNTDYNQSRFIIISVTGRIRVCTPKSASDPYCNSSSK